MCDIHSPETVFTPTTKNELKGAIDQCEQSSSGDPPDDPRFPAVDIDTGMFKYVLIEATNPAGQTYHLVRGHTGVKYTYHIDVARETINELQKAGWKHDVLGGGKIEHDAEAKTIKIYGPLSGSWCECV